MGAGKCRMTREYAKDKRGRQTPLQKCPSPGNKWPEEVQTGQTLRKGMNNNGGTRPGDKNQRSTNVA